MKGKSIEIQIETQERILIRRISSSEVEMFCVQCDANSVFLQPERAASLLSIPTREVYRRIERGTIHFFETETGSTLACSASLSSEATLVNLDGQLIGEVYEEQ